MKVFLLAPENNNLEKKFTADLIKKVENIGCKAEKEDIKNCEALVIILDGRNLNIEDYIKLGIFLGSEKKENKELKKIILGFNISNKEIDKNIKKYLDHSVKTEYNLIGCLKDYLFFINKLK